MKPYDPILLDNDPVDNHTPYQPGAQTKAMEQNGRTGLLRQVELLNEERRFDRITELIMDIARSRLEADSGCQGGINAKIHSVIADIMLGIVVEME